MASKIEVEPKALGKNPFTVICYCCGREYGSKSISIHEKECLEKWEIQNNALPKNMRKPKPVRPTIHFEDGSELHGSNAPVGSDSGKSALASYNDAAYEEFQNQALFPCETCGRKFVPTALEHHRNACKPGGLFDKTVKPKRADAKSQSPEKPKTQGLVQTKVQGAVVQKLMPCKICDRKFLPSALEHHSKVCTDGGYFQKHPPPKSGGIDHDMDKEGAKNNDISASANRSSCCPGCRTKIGVSRANFCSNCGIKLTATCT